MNSTPMPIRGLTMRTTASPSTVCPLRDSVIRARACNGSGLLVQMKQPPREISQVTPFACVPVSRSMSSASAAKG